MKTFRLAITVTALILGLCLLASLWSRVAGYYDAIALEEAAHRIGVTPAFKNIQRYLESSIRNGMSRREVEKILQRVAPIELLHREEVGDQFGLGIQACDKVLLKIGPFYEQYPINICYSGGDSVISWGFDGLDAP